MEENIWALFVFHIKGMEEKPLNFICTLLQRIEVKPQDFICAAQ